VPRLLSAFLLAPLAGLCGGAVLTWLLFSINGAVTLAYAPLMVLGGAFFAYPFVLVVGVPIFLVLRHFRITSIRAYVAIGALSGVVGWVVASSEISSQDLYARALSEFVFGVSAGTLGATVFRRIAVVRSEA
jgi:hypothetical protein